MNQNIFNLVENPNDLPSSNENMADLFYREILPTRNIQDIASTSSLKARFGGTNISIRWNFDNRTWWIPSRSYFKFTLELTKPGDGSIPLRLQDQIAPNMSMAASLLQKMTYKMNDTQVCSITQYIPQCDTLAKRMYHSSEWLNNNIGKNLGYMNPYHQNRLQEFVKDGLLSQTVAKPAFNFDIYSKEELGFGPVDSAEGAKTTAMTLSVAGVITFVALGEYDINNNTKNAFLNLFQPGDHLLLKAQTDNFYSWYIISISNIATKTIEVISLNTVNRAGVVGTILQGGYDMKLFRHRDKIVDLNQNDIIDSTLSTVTYTAATNVLSTNGLFLNMTITDLAIFCNTNNNTELKGGYITFDSALAGSTNKRIHTNGVGVDTGGLAIPNALNCFKYSQYYKFIDKVGLGLAAETTYIGGEDNGQGNSYIKIVLVANSKIKLSDIFQIGDIILLDTAQTPAGVALIRRQVFFVIKVDPKNDNKYLQVAISNTNTLAFNIEPIDNTPVLNILRYVPKNEFGSLKQLNESANKSKIELCWKPSCLSIFNYPGAIPGGYKSEIEIQALNQKYGALAIETPPGIKKIYRYEDSISGSDFQLLIKDLKFYACQVQGPIAGDQEYSYYLNLNELRVHDNTIVSTALTQTHIDVSPSSYALALAFQDRRADGVENTDLSISKLRSKNGEELALTRYSIRFAGLSVPQPEADIKVSENEELLINSYIRNQIYTNQMFKQSGGESYSDWKERGIYLYHPFIRSAGNREGRAYVTTQFNTDPSLGVAMSQETKDNLRLFVFEFYRAFALVRMKNGYVYEVRTANQ